MQLYVRTRNQDRGLRRSAWMCLVLSLIFLALPASAQTSAGAVVGLVRDATGAAVPTATVIVTNKQTNVVTRVQTDTSGNYFVPSVPLGVYSVVCEHPGFKKVVIAPVQVEVNQTVRVDLSLQVGDTSESVTVQEYASLVQTDTPTIGQVVNARQLTELPLNGRDFRNLLSLNPGVTQPAGGIAVTASIRRQGFNDSIRMVSVNGARPSSMNYLIDGVSINEPFFQFPTQIPPIEAIEEFKLQNALYPAEFGNGVGQVSLAMKAGTNDVHGSVWEFMRNDALQKYQPRFHTKTPLKQNQFGFAAGGPAYIPKLYDGRNRTFVFGSYQGGRRVTNAISVGQIPSTGQRTGDFSDWPTQLYDPLSGVLTPGQSPAVARSPFPNNKIPTDRFAPQSTALVKYWPDATSTCKFPCNNYQRALGTKVVMDQYSLRADHNVSTNDRVFWQFLHSNETAPVPSLIPLSGVVTGQGGWLSSLQWTHIFSPRFLNEVRLAYNHFRFDQTFETTGGGHVYWQEAGLKNLVPGYEALPAMSPATGYTGIGYGGSTPTINVSNTQHFVEHMTFTTGRHSMKWGVDFRRGRDTAISGFQGNGIISFSGVYSARNPTLSQVAGAADTGNGFADYMMGFAATAAGVPFDYTAVRTRHSDTNLFFHDDIRVSSRVTLNLGLRWEHRGPWQELSGGGKVFDFNYPGGRALYADEKYAQMANNPVLASCCALPYLYEKQWKDFAPRVGVAWRPTSSNRMVVRAGYGIFYDVLHRQYDMGPYSMNVPYLMPTLPGITGLESTPPLNVRNLFPDPLPLSTRQFSSPYCSDTAKEITDPATGKITVTNQCFGQSVQYAMPNNKTPYTQNWGLNIQFEPRRRMLLEVGYQGSHGLRAQTQFQANQATLPPISGNANNSVRFASQCPAGTYNVTCFPIQERVPYKNFVPQLLTFLNDNQAIYHALTAKVEQRFTDGLQLMSAFTYGRVIDQVSEIQTQGGTSRLYPQYAQRKDLERGVANYDQTLRSVTSVLYEMPIGKGKRWLNQGGIVNAALGGWQTNLIMTFAAGLPYTVACNCGDRAQTGNDRDVERMNLVGNPYPEGFTSSLTKQFNTAAYAVPALGTLGTVGRNTLRGPGQKSADLSLFKNFKIQEKLGIQFRAEAFNLMASPYYVNLYPTFNGSAANFGSLVPIGGDWGQSVQPAALPGGAAADVLTPVFLFMLGCGARSSTRARTAAFFLPVRLRGPSTFGPEFP